MQADKASCDNPWNTALWWKKRETHRVAALHTQGKRSGWPALGHWVRLRHWGALVPGSLSRPTHTAYRFETCTSQNTHVTLPLYSLSMPGSARLDTVVGGPQSSRSSTVCCRLFFKYVKPTLKQTLSKSTSRNLSQEINQYCSIRLTQVGLPHSIII